MKYLRNIVILFLIGSNCLFASDNKEDTPTDTIALEAIEIVAQRLSNFTTGNKIQRIQAIEIENYNTSNLSELFSESAV